MFFKKNSEKAIQKDSLSFLFKAQNQLLRFNWSLMDQYSSTKNVNLIDSMNLIQDAINSLNKAQSVFTKIPVNDTKIVDIKKSIINKK